MKNKTNTSEMPGITRESYQHEIERIGRQLKTQLKNPVRTISLNIIDNKPFYWEAAS